MDRWQSRPLVAGAIRLAVLITPIALSVVLVSALARSFPRPEGLAKTAGWWLALSAASTVALVLMDRVFRKFLPLVALFKLSLVFPDKAPSRFNTALRTGTVRQLKRQMESGEFSSSAPQEAAEQLVGLASALNAHDRLTRGHTERVRAYSVMIGEELGLSEHDLELLNWSGLVHDIGKLTVPTEILNKAGKPSEEEWQILRNHPAKADALIEPLRPWLGEWAESATEHHERFDGKGYPKGLAGRDITLAGRIVAIADAYDVMTSTRSYKKPMPAAVARKELADNAGTQFDPEIVRSFLRVSIGRLQLVAGPLGSLIQLPAGSASIGTTAVTGASAITTIVVAGAAGLLVPAQETSLPVPEVVAMIDESYDAPNFTVDGIEDNSLTIDLAALLDEPGTSIELVEIPESGTVQVSDSGTVTFVPDADFNGQADITYEACFEDGNCSQGKIIFDVEPVNDPPAGVDDDAFVNEDELLVTDVVTNDTDIDGDTLIVTAVRLISGPDTLSSLATLDSEQTTISVQGLQDQSGLAVVEYTLSDQAGASATARLSIEIYPINDAPNAVDDHTNMVENSPQTIDVLGNDSDIDGDKLRIHAINSVYGGSATTDGKAIIFTPTPGHIGSAGLTYVIRDESDAADHSRLVINVLDDPLRPALVADTATTAEDQAVNIDVLANDATNGAALDLSKLRVSAPPSNGVATTLDGKVSYNPNANWSGTDTFNYYVCDVQSYCGHRLVTVVVEATNDAPTFDEGTDITVSEDSGAQVLPGWASNISAGPDNEAEQALTFAVAASQPVLFAIQPTLSSSGELSFTPAPDANGVSSISIVITDSGSNEGQSMNSSSIAQASITLSPQNDAPQFVAGTNPTVVEDAGLVTLSNWATAMSAGPADESLQTLTYEIGSSNPGLFTTPPALDTDGELTFTPATDANGTSVLTLVLVDDGGTANGGVDRSGAQYALLNISADNDAPIAVDDGGTGYTMVADTTLVTANVLANDSDVDNQVAQSIISIVTPTTTGTLTNLGDGTFSFVPTPGWDGTETFDYTITDAGGLTSNTATVTIVVQAAPVANAGGPYAISEGASLSLDGSNSVEAGSGWNWDLDNDGQFDDATGQTPTLNWATLSALGIDDDGTYTVALEVADGADTAAVSLVVANTSPTLTTTGASTVGLGSPYTLNLSATDPGDDLITSWTINWGDGAIEVIAGNPSAVTHTYATSGFTFDILVSASDEDGTILQNELLVPSFDGDAIFRFAPTSGAFLQAFAATTSPIEALIGPDGNLYVSGEDSDNVLRFNAETGNLIDEFVTAASGTLDGAEGMAFGPDGNLYVASFDGNNIIRFDATTGTSMGIFTSGISKPYDLVFGPDSNLYVGTYTGHGVTHFDGSTGIALGWFVPGAAGGLDTPEQMAFGPDGNLYVASFETDQVLRYDGSTGVYIDVFVDAGGAGDLDEPSGLAFGPDGNLYVADHTDDVILRYDGSTGVFIDEYVAPGAGGLTKPGPMTFLATTRVLVTP